MENYKSLSEAAKIFDVPYQTIYFWLTRGRIEGVKLIGSRWYVPDSTIKLYREYQVLSLKELKAKKELYKKYNMDL